MARQPLTLPALALVLLAVGCRDDSTYSGAFDMPTAVAVVQPEVGGPFEEPIGVVASGRSGSLGMLALKQGRFLTDDSTASFLRAAWLPTGQLRLLGAIATWAPDAETIEVFAADQAYEQLLRVPYVRGTDSDGSPAEVAVTHTEPVFVDADSSGDSPTLDDIEIKQGYTSTEAWTIEFDGEVWHVEGSRSGRQEHEAVVGEPWVGDDRVLAFTARGQATAGDRFELSTDSGLVEYDVGGSPLQLAMSPDQSVLAMVVHDPQLDAPVLRWFDPVAGQVTAESTLETDSRPARLAWSPDGSELFVADAGRSAAWVLTAPDAATEIPLPWPIFDLAPLLSDDSRLLYVAPTTARSVWIVDLDDGQLVDINAHRPGVDGMEFDTPVRGLEPIPIPYRWPEQDDADVHLWGRSVAVSLQAGRVQFMEEGTGCLVRDESGPRTVAGQFGQPDYDANYSTVTGAYLELNETNNRHVQVNPCGGIARTETWRLRYDRVLQGWELEGSLSGVQERIAYEDERYVSDDGAFSFVIRSGASPSEDGWRLEFRVLAGVLQVDGDNNHDGVVNSDEPDIDLPGDPVFFWYRVGPTDGGWDAVDERPFVLVAAEGSDVVGRAEPQTGDFEVQWQ